MAESAWSDSEAAGPAKKKIPTWLWFCGGGCLLAVLVGVVALGFGYQLMKRATNPELQKQNLAKILPYDEWPKEMEPKLGMQFFGEQYQFLDSRGYQEQIQLHRGPEGTKGRQQLFNTDHPEFPQNMVVMKFEDLTPGTVLVQGREVAVIRMRMEFAGFLKGMMPDEVKNQLSDMAFIDLTPETLEGMLLMQVTRTKGTGSITDEEIREILRPFHVGPDRGH